MDCNVPWAGIRAFFHAVRKPCKFKSRLSEKFLELRDEAIAENAIKCVEEKTAEGKQPHVFMILTGVEHAYGIKKKLEEKGKTVQVVRYEKFYEDVEVIQDHTLSKIPSFLHNSILKSTQSKAWKEKCNKWVAHGVIPSAPSNIVERFPSAFTAPSAPNTLTPVQI